MRVCRDCLYLDVEYIFSGVGEAEKKYPYAVCLAMDRVIIPRKDVDRDRRDCGHWRRS